LDFPARFDSFAHVVNAFNEKQARLGAAFVLAQGTRLFDEWIGKTGKEFCHAPIVSCQCKFKRHKV
jgi:hypothetical protein